MTRTTGTSRRATPHRGADSDPEHEPAIAIVPALGPIPPIALIAGTIPTSHLHHATSNLLSGTRVRRARAHRGTID